MDEFVDHNIAKQLRDIGFNDPCFACFKDEGLGWLPTDFSYIGVTNYETSCTAPTYYQVFQWFRDIHNIHSSIAWVTKGYDFYVKKEPSRIINETTHVYSNYRECEIACIEYMINLVKNERTIN